eukprot:g73860.t1
MGWDRSAEIDEGRHAHNNRIEIMCITLWMTSEKGSFFRRSRVDEKFEESHEKYRFLRQLAAKNFADTAGSAGLENIWKFLRLFVLH